ncbi:MAG: hypothetical protein V4787_24160 [Pseudomonadota bacterium]
MREGEAIFAGLRDELFGCALGVDAQAPGAHPLESLDGERRILELAAPHCATVLPMDCKADVVRVSDCTKLARPGNGAQLFDVILIAQEFEPPPRMEPFFRRLHSWLRPGGRVMGALSAADHLAELWADAAITDAMLALGLAPPRRFHAAGVAVALDAAGFWIHRVCHESGAQPLAGGRDGLSELIDAMRRNAKAKRRNTPDLWMDRLVAACRERLWRDNAWAVTSAAIEFVAVKLERQR